MSNHDPDMRLTLEESRYLDGALAPEVARRIELELAADPARARRLERYRETMAVWREDVQRRAEALPSDALADRVLASLAQGNASPGSTLTATSARIYAAAAVVLIAFGVAGTLHLTARRGVASTTDRPDLGLIETTFAQVVQDDPDLLLQPPNLESGTLDAGGASERGAGPGGR